MRIRNGLGALICCCAGLAACTAASRGPAATVTTPVVGRPPAPVSAQAALSSEAFTPYAGLGAADNDGLAPGDTYDALHTACMNDAGYGQYAAQAPYPVRTNRGLAFAQAFGPWGYIGTALAAQQGFLAGSGLPAVGGAGGGEPGAGPGQPGGPFSSLPTGAQTAAGKCFNILENFNNAQFAHSMAVIETLNNYISTDVIQDGEFKKAVRDWSACMARNGFSSSDADTFSQQAQVTLGLRPAAGQNPSGPPGAPTAAQNQAQIAMAVADANCTLISDLSGIYFAVQANYEQQFVSANQQALNAAVRQYKAAFANALKTLPALLRTASATPNLLGPARPGHHGRRRSAAKPSPSHSGRPSA
ncbi:MAG TPA: hypothetical protein VEG33_03615 [Streptosporangiaceae bacterium]|nr:hypothetical protein [Streptosporangiaceae bacterium]